MKSEQVDLDALELDYNDGDDRIPTLIAELRASRKVVEAVTAYLHSHTEADGLALSDALAELDSKDG